MTRSGRGYQSKHAHLKPAVLHKFAEGLDVSTVQKLFPEISYKTLQDWRNQAIKAGTLVILDVNEEKPDNLPENVSYIFDRKKASIPVVTLDTNETDLGWAKRVCREIVEDDLNNIVRIKAIDTFLKAVALQAARPELMAANDAREADTIDYSEIDPQELTRLYQDMLSG